MNQNNRTPGLFLVVSLFAFLFFHEGFGQGETCTTALAVGIGHHTANGPGSGNGASGMSCGAASGGNPAHADWYTFTPGQDGIYTITSTNDPALTDTRLKIWTGTCGALICFAGDDDNGTGFTSLVSECFTAGTTYYIEWDNVWSTSGFEWDIILENAISCGPPANDQCTGAITLNPGCAILGNNLFATDNGPPICGSADDSISGGVWFKVIGNGASITATTCNPGTNFDTQMLLYDGACNNLNCLAGNDDQGNPLDPDCDVLGISENRASTIEWNSNAGVAYYLYVAGYGTLTGFFELSLESSVTGPCSCDPPQAICRDITVSLDTAGIAVISPADIDSNSTASCGLLEMTLTMDTLNFTNIGTNLVSLIITDIEGASDTCQALVTVSPIPHILYVDSTATGNQTGASWSDAFLEVRHALQFAAQYPIVDTVLVAKGTYLPGATTDRTVSFELTDSLFLLGGFPAGGAPFSDRNPDLYPAKLSGDIGISGFTGDNVFHVMVIESQDAAIVVDGFSIQDGLADGAGLDSRGSALLVFGKAEFRNVNIHNNTGLLSGSAVYCSGTDAVLKIKDCHLTGTSNSHSMTLLNVDDAVLIFQGQTMIQEE